MACGSDALRWALIGYMAQGRQINLDIGRVVTARQFCNKIWQAARFTLMHLDRQNAEGALRTDPLPRLATVEELLVGLSTGGAAVSGLPLGQRWLLSRLAHAAEACEDGLEGFNLAGASGAAQRFLLNEVCDEYIEMTKLALHGKTSSLVGGKEEASAVLYLGLHSSLRLLHPFLPFGEFHYELI